MRCRDRELPGRQGGRRHRGLRDQAGRAHALLSPLFVAVLKIHLFFPDTGSLKGKRAELRPVKHHLAARLGCAVAEVDHHDTWQRATLGAAVVGRTEHDAAGHADAVCRWLDGHFPQGVRVERSIASWNDLED